MPYELSLLAPNLLRVEMTGHIDRKTAEAYYPAACKLLDNCPKRTNMLVITSCVRSSCPSARPIMEKVRYHPNVGMYIFVVNQSYLLLFSPIVKFFGGIHLFGSENEAMAFLERESVISSSQVPT